MARRHDPYDVPQARRKHPDPWQRDLNPHHLDGQNVGARSTDVRPDMRYASGIKQLTRELKGFTLDELDQIPVLLAGARLSQGAVYCDVSDASRPVFRAEGDMRVPRDHYLVPKHAVHYAHWNRLRGLTAKERL